MIDFIANMLLQGLTFGVAVLGVSLAFRISRYPDLTADGSFILGACVFAMLLQSGLHFLVCILVAILSGALAGIFTGVIGTFFKVNRLLSGILTSMIAYSLCFRIMDGRSFLGLKKINKFIAQTAPDIGLQNSLYFKLLCAVIACVFVIPLIWRLLTSELGLVLRGTGENPDLCKQLERNPKVYVIIGLGLSNALIASSGILVSSQMGFADINMSIGLIITLIAGLILGEEVLRFLKPKQKLNIADRIIAPFIGMILYYTLYLFALKASINGWIPFDFKPTDLKLVSAVVLILAMTISSRRNTASDVIPI